MNGKFVEISKSFFVAPEYKAEFARLGLTAVDAVFSFAGGKNLVKNNLASYRSRIQFEMGTPPGTVFLKRYDNAPVLGQLKNWLCHRDRKSYSFFECEAADKLTATGINTPKVIAYGEKWGLIFEKRSFIITEKLPEAEAIERKLPDYFKAPATQENLGLRKSFISQLAAFIRKFHTAGYRHRDLYFSHVFYGVEKKFYLIDLARCFEPGLFAERFRVKDIAQLCYSAPTKYFSRTDRLRFYFEYAGQKKLTRKDKVFISRVLGKVKRIRRHDIRNGRIGPS
jgi:hypothetical protein